MTSHFSLRLCLRLDASHVRSTRQLNDRSTRSISRSFSSPIDLLDSLSPFDDQSPFLWLATGCPPNLESVALSPVSYEHVLYVSGSVVRILSASPSCSFPFANISAPSRLPSPLLHILRSLLYSSPGDISDPPAIVAGKNPSRSAA